MTTSHDLREPAPVPSPGREADSSCFLCALDPIRQNCALPRLEGRLLSAHLHTIGDELVPILTLETGAGRVALWLTRYYRDLVKELRARGRATKGLAIRVYHLPRPPESIEDKGLRYYGNSYTLVVVEPDTLLNISDLNHAAYCSRQYLLNRLVPSPTSEAAVRGNFVHSCFKELLKEHDRGEQMLYTREETPLMTLQRHFERELERNRVELAMSNISPEALRAEVTPHLESLATWFQNQRDTLWDMPAAYLSDPAVEAAPDPDRQAARENMVRAETFLLAPEIGLKGRLDLLWRQSSRQRLLELKTGGARGDLPKSSHCWQVYGYHALLTVRRDSQMQKALATLLYSGTPGHAEAYGIPFSIRELQSVNEKRNLLVLSHVSGVPSAPPGPSRCTKCALLEQCQQVSGLLSWQPPEPDLPEDDSRRNYAGPSEEDRTFFSRYYQLLQLEGREGESQQALLWRDDVAQRIARGAALGGLQPLGRPQPTGQGEWWQTFRCANTSELRVGDEILLSDGNPITGEVVTGTITAISAEEVTVWTPELINHPSLLERHGTDVVHVRTVQNLVRWLNADPHLRALVSGQLRPRFATTTTVLPPPRADFNAEQNLAVMRALQMQDYLLIHGPPGTGKTSVIAEIVKQLRARGQRIMLAAFTNQAVDNMLKRLDSEGLHDYVRLGHERSVADEVQPRLLRNLASPQEASPRDLRELLRRLPIVASTTATWSSDKYAPIDVAESSAEPLLQFDVALIDEAGQLTIPAILGALRFAKRFILVGDEKQLPPLVLSPEAARTGLAQSLFSDLKLLAAETPEASSDAPTNVSPSVSLRTQYRMHEKIAGFASQQFYAGQLLADPAIATRLLRPSGSLKRLPGDMRGLLEAIRPTSPIVFLNVESSQQASSGVEGKTSASEAHTIRDLVALLLSLGLAPAEIGIIAPYRAQVANLRRYLFSDAPQRGWLALPGDTPLTIDTVDRFQGGERQVIIMSFATEHVPNANSPLRSFLTDPQRLNVALTRAQRKLLLVGHAQALQDLPYFRELLDYCRSLGTLINHTAML